MLRYTQITGLADWFKQSVRDEVTPEFIIQWCFDHLKPAECFKEKSAYSDYVRFSVQLKKIEIQNRTLEEDDFYRVWKQLKAAAKAAG